MTSQNLLRLVCLLTSIASAASHAQPSPADRWHKVDAMGRRLPVSEGPWTCVQDTRSGLMWENKSDNEGQRHAAATHSWYDPIRGVGAPRAGSCLNAEGTNTLCDTHMHVQTARQQRWCGRADWRLPTTAELQTLLHATGYAGDPMIATGYFPHTGRAAYWTADLVNAGGTHLVRLVHFLDGKVITLPPGSAARLRLVSGPTPR